MNHTVLDNEEPRLALPAPPGLRILGVGGLPPLLPAESCVAIPPALVAVAAAHGPRSYHADSCTAPVTRRATDPYPATVECDMEFSFFLRLHSPAAAYRGRDETTASTFHHTNKRGQMGWRNPPPRPGLRRPGAATTARLDVREGRRWDFSSVATSASVLAGLHSVGEEYFCIGKTAGCTRLQDQCGPFTHHDASDATRKHATGQETHVR